jgi:hypothetical protein
MSRSEIAAASSAAIRDMFRNLSRLYARFHRRALVVPVLIFTLACVYRFNALGGALGGFDGDHFIYYLGARAVAHGERPLRDFADAGLQGAWPALTYELPALAQRIGGATLLSEAVFVVGALALALAVLAFTAAQLSGSFTAFLVALATLFASVKLYGYSKVLVFSVAAALFLRYAREPSRARAGQLACWSAVAFLFRHDFLVYLVPPIAVLVGLSARRWRETVDHVLVFGATLAVLLAGPVYSVHHFVGVGSYLESARALVAQEANRTTFRWPQFGPLTGSVSAFLANEDNAVAWLYDVSIAVPVLALVALAGSPRAAGLDPRQTRAVVASLALLALILDRYFLRNNLGARFGDLGAPVAILAAWLSFRFQSGPVWRRGLAAAVALIVLIPTMQALATTGGVWRELDTTGLSDSVTKIGRRLVTVTSDLRAIPPAAGAPADAEANAAEYVRLCTAATDRVLVVADAPEILGMAGRPFAGGHPTFRPGFYRLEKDQRVTLDRIRAESVPIVLLDEEGSYTSHFVPQFSLIDAYIMAEYQRAGTLAAPAGPAVQVFSRRDRIASGQYRMTGLPCFVS